MAALGLLALGVALRLWLILRGWPALDSDEAIMGLMARHILLLGEHPIFFYGQHYLGVPDAYLLAGVFALLGQSTLALHLTMLALTTAFLALVYALGRAAYGPAVGLLTLAYLALGPAFGLLRETAAIGGYQVTLLLGSLLCLLVYAELRRPAAYRATTRARLGIYARYALMGLVAGLGIWTDALMLPFVAAAVLALAFGRPRVLRSLAPVIALVGLLIGALPLLIFNVQSHGTTFVELVDQNTSTRSHVAASAASWLAPIGAALSAWFAQIGGALSVGLPTLLGSPRVCVSRGGIWPSYPPALAVGVAAPGFWCAAPNTLFALAVIACYVVVAWQLAQAVLAWWRTHPSAPLVAWAGRVWRLVGRAPTNVPPDVTTAPSAADRERAARLWLRAMLLAVSGTILLYTLSNTSLIYEFTAARYLLPIYVTLPLVFGVLWEAARPVATRLWSVLSRWASSGRPYAVSAPRGAPNGGTAVHPATAPDAGNGHTLAQSGDAGNTRNRRTHHTLSGSAGWRRGVAPAVAALLLVVLLGFAAYGGVAATSFASDGTQFALPAPPQDRALLATLGTLHITRFVSDYWTCYRLAFESGEQVRCAARDRVNNTLTTNSAVNRYAPYLALIKATSRPAYIFTAGSAWDAGLAGVSAWASAQRLPSAGYVRLVSAGYAIYYDPAGQG